MGELLFSVTKKDCRWDYFRGSGAGGQKRNKTSSGVRCTHMDSGAVGKSDDTRSQHKNKRTAFIRMTETKRFKAWHKLEVSRCLGDENAIKQRVEEAMKPWNLMIEYGETGKDYG